MERLIYIIAGNIRNNILAIQRLICAAGIKETVQEFFKNIVNAEVYALCCNRGSVNDCCQSVNKVCYAAYLLTVYGVGACDIKSACYQVIHNKRMRIKCATL